MRHTRRQFLRATLAASALASAPSSFARTENEPFTFLLLGDLHYDKLEHHDRAWIAKHKSGDWRQIENYSRLTIEMLPHLFATVRETIAELNRTPETRVAFVLQVGDLVEGLCGTEELAARQNREALDFIRAAQLGAPFVFTKGNHDVTGDGAPAAFTQVLEPFQREMCASLSSAGETSGANYSFVRAGVQFCCFDAYSDGSLDWLEGLLARRRAAQFFFVVHPPVVPYGARATWHIYASERHASRREKLLGLLGKHEAVVLGGHIHRFSALARATAGGGRFAQLAVSSIIGTPRPEAKTVLDGVESYSGDQVRVEPQHSPDTEAQRRAVYETERAHVRAFAYADLPGYAVVTVNGPAVTARIFSGTTRLPWRTVDLRQLLRG